MTTQALPYGPLSQRTVHLCIDMQNMFAARTDWHVPWMERVLPTLVRLAEARPESTIFTRFVPPATPEEMQGTWRRYYRRWEEMTGRKIDPALIELVDPLRELVPPATLFDKRHYSPFTEPGFQKLLRERGVDSLVITGSETDVCVLSAVLGAVDRGYRVVLAKDALCSVSDEMHDALIGLYTDRFGQQIEVAPVDSIIRNWES